MATDLDDDGWEGQSLSPLSIYITQTDPPSPCLPPCRHAHRSLGTQRARFGRRGREEVSFRSLLASDLPPRYLQEHSLGPLDI